MDIHRHINDAMWGNFDKHGKFFLCGNLKDFLAQIVAKLVNHKIREERCNTLNEGPSEIIFGCVIFKFLLKHATALLIVAIEIYLFEDILILFW